MFRSFIILVYLALYLVIGGVLIIISLNVFSIEQITGTITYIYDEQNLKVAAGVIGVMFVLIGIISSNISFGKMQREKTIAFENPDGQVVVSLTAIEDFIRRIVKQIPQVKDLRPVVIAGKKGISVTTRAVLFSDSNIPEVTERIQSLIKTKLLEMLGIEETITIKMHVSKLLHKAGKDEIPERREESRHIPFGGME